MTRTYIFRNAGRSRALAGLAAVAVSGLLAGCGSGGTTTPASVSTPSATPVVASSGVSAQGSGVQASSGTAASGSGSSNGGSAVAGNVSGGSAVAGSVSSGSSAGQVSSAATGSFSSASASYGSSSGGSYSQGASSQVQSAAALQAQQAAAANAKKQAAAAAKQAATEKAAAEKAAQQAAANARKQAAANAKKQAAAQATKHAAQNAGSTKTPIHTTQTPQNPASTGRTKVVVRYVTRYRTRKEIVTKTKTIVKNPAIPSGAFLPSKHPELAQNSFTIGGSNIGCQIKGATVRCGIQNRSWAAPVQPASCNGNWGDTIALGGHGLPKFACGGSNPISANAKVIPSGWDDKVGKVTCEIRSFGVNCFSASSHSGFLISRTGYSLY